MAIVARTTALGLRFLKMPKRAAKNPMTGSEHVTKNSGRLITGKNTLSEMLARGSSQRTAKNANVNQILFCDLGRLLEYSGT